MTEPINEPLSLSDLEDLYRYATAEEVNDGYQILITGVDDCPAHTGDDVQTPTHPKEENIQYCTKCGLTVRKVSESDMKTDE